MNRNQFNELNGRLANIVRVGRVVDVIADKCKVRVEFQSKNVVSRELYVIQPQAFKDKYYSLPSIDEYVVCLFLGGEDTGFVIGSYYNQNVTCVESNKAVTSIIFEDGTSIKYDKASSTLTADVKGDINISSATNINVTCDKDVTIKATSAKIEADKVEIGSGAIESTILGETFKKYFDGHVHTGNLGAPTGPPTPTMPSSCLSTVVKNS